MDNDGLTARESLGFAPDADGCTPGTPDAIIMIRAVEDSLERGWSRASDAGNSVTRALRLTAALAGIVGMGLTGQAAVAGPFGEAQPAAIADGMVHRVAVFGVDDRTAVPKRFARYAASIGLFFSNPARTVCSAFCVAPDIVATAAHCLAQPGGKPARIADFMFARGYDQQRDFSRVAGFATGSSSQSVTTGDFHHRVRPPIDAANDWALVRLDRQACPGTGLPITVLSADAIIAAAKAGRVFQLSYHRDWAQWRLAYSKPCAVNRNFNGADWASIAPDFMAADTMILHQCDTGGASSGSPMLIEDRDGVAVIGINVGTYVQSKILTDNGQVTLREKAETVANTAVNASAFRQRLALLEASALLASGKPMRSLQEQLATRRYYLTRVDGSYGPQLKSAIETYERASNLPVTGLATEALLRRLTEQSVGGLGSIAPTSAPPRGFDVPRSVAPSGR